MFLTKKIIIYTISNLIVLLSNYWIKFKNIYLIQIQ